MSDTSEMKKSKVAYGEILKGILMILGAVGILTVGVTCPNLLQLVPSSYRKRYSGHSIRRAIHLLDKKGWIALKETEEGWKIKLTQQGYTGFSHTAWDKKEFPNQRSGMEFGIC